MKTSEQFLKNGGKFWQKWSIAFRIIPMVLVVTLLKFMVHHFGWEVMELNGLFTSLVGGTIFLIGFLISGVLSDYKESEKIPSELTGSIKNMLDDCQTIIKTKNSEAARRLTEFQKSYLASLMHWFYKKERTKELLKKTSSMNDFFAEFELEGVQPAFIVRLKNEQGNLRRLILRIDTIRDTDFVSSAYAIVEAMGIAIAAGLIFIKIEPFYASLFFTILVTYLIYYMFLLIKDLDNPFDYATNGEGGTEVSLKPLHDLESLLQDQE